jgi:hypothetical protein
MSSDEEVGGENYSQGKEIIALARIRGLVSVIIVGASDVLLA